VVGALDRRLSAAGAAADESFTDAAQQDSASGVHRWRNIRPRTLTPVLYGVIVTFVTFHKIAEPR
jgi:hypothetical protein